MSYNFDDFKDKEEHKFNYSVAPKDNLVPGGMIKDQERSDVNQYQYKYQNYKKETCFWIKRGTAKNGKKEFTPMSYDTDKATWVPKAWTKDRPLFGEHVLTDKPVIVVEGEKTKLEGDKLFQDYDVVTWSGGANQVHQTNFEALMDREVILWADNDAPGIKAMHEVALTLLDKNLTENISIINPREELDEGWDIADPLPSKMLDMGVTVEGLLKGKSEYIPDDKIIKKIRNEQDQRIQKEVLKTIQDQYIYLRQTDNWFEMLTKEFVNLKILDHDKAHIFKNKAGEGNISKLLLSNPKTPKALCYIKLAHREPGLINVTKKDNPLITPGKYLNIYNPHDIEAIEGDCSVILDFFIWLMGPENWKVVEQVVAFFVQHPGKKMRWCPLVVSPEGAGKGLFSLILGHMLGMKNVAANVDYQDLISKHSTIVRDNLIVVLNEVVVEGKHSERKEVSNALKSFITDDFLIIEAKNKDQVNTLNSTNFFVFSNEKDCLSLNTGSRRYFVAHVKHDVAAVEKITEEGKFDELFDFIEQGKGINYLYHHFKNLKIEDLKSFQRRAPKTAELSQMIADNLHPIIKQIDSRFIEQREPFTQNWLGYLSKGDVIDWCNANIKGHAPEKEIEVWLKEKALPWKNGDLTRQIVKQDGSRPRNYLLKDRPADRNEGSYKDWTDGDLGYAIFTDGQKIEETQGPNTLRNDLDSSQSKAIVLARQVQDMPYDVIKTVHNFIVARDKALNKIRKNLSDHVGEGYDKDGMTLSTSVQSKARDEYMMQFSKDIIEIFNYEKTGENPSFISKRRPPNVEIKNYDEFKINPGSGRWYNF